MQQQVSREDVLKALNTNPKYDYSHFLRKSRPDLAGLLISRALTGNGRKIVIRLIKWPLEKAIVKAARLYVRHFGRVTAEQTVKHNTHILLDLRQEFFQHYTNQSKMPLMKAAWELLPFENEHDVHYEWLFNWLVKRINEERAKGNWIDLPDVFPQEGCWK